ncbi:chaperone protein DnaJ [Drosophila gunungcola]|uniref:chaperone protein DnaJ n=1 Tax=Drosophila gunungcola TaxID=103775 RepID=UPI0022DECE4F|nr:chaperone protein DnaJ [Drosophila gunungcola]
MLRTVQSCAGPPVRQLASYGSRFTYQSNPMAQPRLENYYQVLNVPVGSSGQEIRRAFIELSKKYHPDASSQTGDSALFMKICEAYQTLQRQHSRQLYDSRLRMQHQATPPPETAFTGRHVCTVWSQYQSAVRNKQMGRGSRRFGAIKPMVFKGRVVLNKWQPVRTALVDLQRMGLKGSWQEPEYSFPNSPIFYLYAVGFCFVGALLLADVISRLEEQPPSEEGEFEPQS